MNRMILLAFVAGLAMAVSTAASAQGRPDGAGNSAGQRASAGQQDKRDAQRERAEIRRLEAEAKKAEAEVHNRSRQMRAENPPDEHADDAAFSAEQNADGQARAEQMRERRDEGKAIKEQYKDDREPGMEGVGSALDKEDDAEKQQQKEKKPWWKFWGD